MKPQRSFQYRHFVYPVILALFLTVSLSSCIAETQPVDPQGVATTLQAALETQAEQESDFGTLRMYLSGVGTHIAELETEIAKIQLEPPIAQQVSSQGTVVSYLATIVGSIQLTSGPYNTQPRAETPTAYILVETSNPPGSPGPYEAYLEPIAFLPGGQQLIVKDASDSGRLKVINLETGEEYPSLQAPGPIEAVTLSPDGQTLAWALEDHRIQRFQISIQDNVLTGQNPVTIWNAHTATIVSLAFSTSGSLLYSASHDGWVRTWDSTGNLVDEFRPGLRDGVSGGSEVFGIGISPDGTKMVATTFEGPPSLWELKDHKKIAEFGASGAFDGARAAFTKDGQIVGINLGAGGGSLSIWKLPEAVLLWSGGSSYGVFAISPEGRYLAYLSSQDDAGNYRVVLSSPDGKELIRELEWGSNPAWKLIFSPDETRLTASGDSKLLIWQIADGSLLYEYRNTPCS